MTASINSDNTFADNMLELKRHIRHCRNCQSAIKVRDKTLLCDHTIGLILTAVIRYDTLISRRLAMKRTHDHVFYACPDITAHGKTWTLTVEPLIPAHVQESLF